MQGTLENTILYLLGFAGSGKLTIAREIAANSPCRLVDNHLVNNVVFSLIHADGKTKLPRTVWDRVDEHRNLVYQTMRDLSPPEFSFVLTNELIEGKETNERIFEQVREVAAHRSAHFLPVRLLVSEGELRRRIVNPERRKMLKTTLEEAAIANSRDNTVFFPKTVPYLDMDITSLTAAEAAGLILAQAMTRQDHV